MQQECYYEQHKGLFYSILMKDFYIRDRIECLKMIILFRLVIIQKNLSYIVNNIDSGDKM